MTSGQGYQVYPEALSKAAKDIDDAASKVLAFATDDLAQVMMGPYDLGLPGTATVLMPGLAGVGTVDRYNQAIEQIREISARNAAQLKILGDALQQAAAFYQSKDEEFYKELKRQEGEIK